MSSAAQGARYPSPLRYPGGKGKVANYIKLVMLRNRLVGREYVEPYAGGASVALSLLFEQYASHVHINDLNVSVHAFWSAVLEQTDELCERIRSVAATVEEWERQRDVQRAATRSTVDLAFSTLFLNRTSRSGIIGAGIIGGQRQQGRWKIDARYRPDELIRRIRRIARFKHRITLTRLDAAELLRDAVPHIPSPFVYLDPPYYVQGGRLYENSYVHEDHAAVADLVKGLDVPWVVSYDAVPQVRALYPRNRAVDYALGYSAQRAYEGDEVMFFSDVLELPDVTSPARVSQDVVDDARLEAVPPGDEGSRSPLPRTPRR